MASLVSDRLAALGPGTPSSAAEGQVQNAMALTVLLTAGLASVLAGPIARGLKVRAGPPGGVLIVGAHRLGRELGRLLLDLGVPVVIADSNQRNIDRAEREGLAAFRGDATDARWLEEVVLNPAIGRVLSITDNPDVDGVVARWGVEHFGAGGGVRWSRLGQEPAEDLAPEPSAAAGEQLAGAQRPLRDVLADLNAARLKVSTWAGPYADAIGLAVVDQGRARFLTNGTPPANDARQVGLVLQRGDDA
jgi:hypothetical protein